MKLLSASRDPVGEAFVYNSHIYRGVRPEYSSYYLGVLNSSTVQNLLGKKIVNTSVSTETAKGFNLVLEHDLISPVSYPYEWTLSMLRDAALLTLDLCIELANDRWILKDATPFNILFDRYTPLWVDFTSIMPQEKDLYWVAYDQFSRTFLFPLLLGTYLNGRAARSLLISNQDGISPQEAKIFMSSFSWLRYPWLLKRLYFPLALIDMARQSGMEDQLAKAKQAIPEGVEKRRKFFANIKEDVLSIRLPDISSKWSDYYRDINDFFSPSKFNQKQKAIANYLEKCRPATVADIGCNQGGYSAIASHSGAKVVAFDNDEDSISLLYRLATEKKLDILPLVGDVLYPSPSCGWRGNEFPPMQKRLCSEMAFALALVHHLAISQNQTFDRIVLTLSEYTTRWLITEFVPITDPRVQEITITSQRDLSWYTLENFVEALNKSFRSVEMTPSYPEGRVLCFCEK